MFSDAKYPEHRLKTGVDVETYVLVPVTGVHHYLIATSNGLAHNLIVHMKRQQGVWKPSIRQVTELAHSDGLCKEGYVSFAAHGMDMETLQSILV